MRVSLPPPTQARRKLWWHRGRLSIAPRPSPQAPHVTHPLPGVTVPSLIRRPGTGEGRARELLSVQAIWADLRVILSGRRRKNKE